MADEEKEYGEDYVSEREGPEDEEESIGGVSYATTKKQARELMRRMIRDMEGVYADVMERYETAMSDRGADMWPDKLLGIAKQSVSIVDVSVKVLRALPELKDEGGVSDELVKALQSMEMESEEDG